MTRATDRAVRAGALVALAITSLSTGTPAPAVMPTTTRSVAGDGFPAYDLGMLADAPSVQGRDGGFSALIGGRSLWAFGDTILTAPASDGSTSRTNTPGLNVPGFLPSTEPTDATGAPAQLVPFSSTELTYNQTHHDGSRYAVWPGGVVERGGQGLVFFGRELLEADQDPVPGTWAMGIADIAPGATIATRRAGALWGPQDCAWAGPFLGTDGYAYFTAVVNRPNRANCPNRSSVVQPIGMARAPLSSVDVQSSWRFWNGTSWSTNQLQTATMLHILSSTLSVEWNDTLDKYLMVTGIWSDSDYLVADAPQGPWSAPEQFVTSLPSDPANRNYHFIQHPEHAGTDDGVLLVHYTRPKVLPGLPYRSETRLLAVDVRPNSAARLDAYITKAYEDITGYAPSAGDRAYWSQRLGDRVSSVPAFLAVLADSEAARRHLVRRVYLEVLDRPADAAGLTFWENQVETNGWGHDVLTAKLAALPEFSADHPTNSAFVEAVYPIAFGRTADSGGLAHWTGRLDAGVSRYNVVRALMTSGEAGRRQAQLAYSELLGRSATTVEAAAVGAQQQESAGIRRTVLVSAEAFD